MRWAMLAVAVGCGALMGAAPGVPGTGTAPAPAATGFVDAGGGGGGNGTPLDPLMPAGMADDISARMAARRAAQLGQAGATMPGSTTLPGGAPTTRGGFGGGGVGGNGLPGASGGRIGAGGLGTSVGNPGGGRGFGAATAPAAPARGGATVSGPNWSNEVNGMRIEGRGNRYMTPQIPMSMLIRLQCTLADEEEICPDDPACWNWEVRDAANRMVPSVNVPAEGKVPEWQVCSRVWSAFVDGPRTDKTETDVLVAGTRRWKLAPGEYTLRGTFSGPSQWPGKRPEIPAWTGKIDLAPVTFTVYGKVTAEELAKAAAAVREQKWADKGEMYPALAKLIQPGMSGAELLSVLPKGTGEDAKWGESGGASSGPIMASRGTYALDADYGVEWSGGGMAGVEGVKVLSTVPRIVTKEEYEEARQPAGARGRGVAAPE